MANGVKTVNPSGDGVRWRSVRRKPNRKATCRADRLCTRPIQRGQRAAQRGGGGDGMNLTEKQRDCWMQDQQDDYNKAAELIKVDFVVPDQWKGRSRVWRRFSR